MKKNNKNFTKPLAIVCAAALLGSTVIGVSANKSDTQIKFNSTPNVELQTNKKETEANTNYISKEKALEVAFKHAGVDANKVKDLEVELEKGKYDISFEVGNIDYDYDINATTSLIIKVEKDVEEVKSNKNEEVKKEEVKTSYISKEKALEIAFKHAGVDSSKVRDLEVELEDGKYDISFEVGTTDYDYDINAKTGEIIHVEKEEEVKKEEVKQEMITKQQALEIAFKNANVDSSKVRDLEVELEDGKYEISFESGNTEYEYEIDATTGKIIKAEKENDDK